MQQTLSCDCLVAGGGPAGLSAAIAAAEAGRRVIVAEYLPSPGRKLLASGSGKCNLTNALPPEALARRFPLRSGSSGPRSIRIRPERGGSFSLPGESRPSRRTGFTISRNRCGLRMCSTHSCAAAERSA